ncbi:hypothetical protein LCGC14_2163950 [marine sediment metagenome]|uniref:Uncharacterized protein n=1 Tax=marine sediment metagenome TaxID=412755 RepID=A0A0F9G4N7_9ZZZZ
MKTIKVIKTGATAVETRKQLRKGVNKVKVESRPNVGPELLDLIELDLEYIWSFRAP